MRERKRIYDMTDRELRAYKRMRRRQEERRKKILSILATLCLAAVCAVSYRALTSSANTGAEELSFKYYTGVTVQYNDTLWDIADRYIDYGRYDTKQDYIKEVCSINGIADESAIRSGQRLVVPYYSPEFVK